MVRIDQNTLLRLKGKFARVCVNIDITKPLPGSVSIARTTGCLRVPLLYEGLHEVCPLCGGESHQIQSCPNLPISQKVEVLVEKFDATGVTTARSTNPTQPLMNSMPNTWVTVSPKKRVKAMVQARPRAHSHLNPLEESTAGGRTPPPPAVFMPYPNPAPLGPDDIILANPSAFTMNNLHDNYGDPLDALGGDMDDANVDAFLNLHNIEDVDMSCESAKRKRREEGEEASSAGPK